jgi:hypothetical protein
MAELLLRLLVRRCAWCDRVWTNAGWAESASAEPDRETATVCPDCNATLRADRAWLSAVAQRENDSGCVAEETPWPKQTPI